MQSIIVVIALPTCAVNVLLLWYKVLAVFVPEYATVVVVNAMSCPYNRILRRTARLLLISSSDAVAFAMYTPVLPGPKAVCE